MSNPLFKVGRQAAMSQLEFRSRTFSKDRWVKGLLLGAVVETSGGRDYREVFRSLGCSLEWDCGTPAGA